MNTNLKFSEFGLFKIRVKGGEKNGKKKWYRSNSMNPNNSAYHASMDNRSDQLNPNHPEYKDDQDEE